MKSYSYRYHQFSLRFSGSQPAYGKAEMMSRAPMCLDALIAVGTIFMHSIAAGPHLVSLRQLRGLAALTGEKPMSKKSSMESKQFSQAVGRALRRAATVARKTARMHGTPIYVWENGKVVAKKP